MGIEDRRRAYRAGRRAEALCALVLRLSGHVIIARDYRTPVGEIDIITRRRRRLYFIEVKTRGRGVPLAEAVTARQRRRISRAAGLFLARNPTFADWDAQFDVMLAAPRRWPRRIANAWLIDDSH